MAYLKTTILRISHSTPQHCCLSVSVKESDGWTLHVDYLCLLKGQHCNEGHQKVLADLRYTGTGEPPVLIKYLCVRLLHLCYSSIAILGRHCAWCSHSDQYIMTGVPSAAYGLALRRY